ncbi:MAG: hypothetical protein ACI8QZ_002621 [Chlamydiales bacterium]
MDDHGQGALTERGRTLSNQPLIDPELLEILACPDTHQGLSMAAAELLTEVNAKIAAGDFKNVGGKVVADALDGGLVREDGKIVYPIRDSIPVLLIDEGLPL